MKQIRHEVFETNSSSTHTMTIMSQSEYEEFKNKLESEDYYIDTEYDLYTKEQVEKEYEKSKKEYEKNNWKIPTFDDWREGEYFTDEEFEKYLEDYKNFFEEKEIGEENVVVMGYYGYNG